MSLTASADLLPMRAVVMAAADEIELHRSVDLCTVLWS
jgi:hypothetical protein